MSDEVSALEPGWYVQINGHEFDLAHWRVAFKVPFDPVALKHSNGATYFRSCEFAELDSAEDVRARALVCIARLNGAMRLSVDAEPIAAAGAVRVDEAGQLHVTLVVDSLMSKSRFGPVTITHTQFDEKGNPLPPPLPEVTKEQDWEGLARANDLASDLLTHYGHADDWFDVYKTIECAEKIFGSEHNLKKALGDDAEALKNLRSTANYYRHAYAYRPPELTPLASANGILRKAVSKALAEARR